VLDYCSDGFLADVTLNYKVTGGALADKEVADSYTNAPNSFDIPRILKPALGKSRSFQPIDLSGKDIQSAYRRWEVTTGAAVLKLRAFWSFSGAPPAVVDCISGREKGSDCRA
jgi:hypothetical protein